MNVAELARILKITPQELRDLLPQLGFSVGQKAIKVDNRTAQKIIKEWPRLIKEHEEKIKLEAKNNEVIEEATEEVKKKVSISNYIIIKDLANLLQILYSLPIS